jgi:hypothetical protein
MRVWKIKQLSTGLFSNGGITPAFNPEGKVWTRKRDLSNHLAQFITEDGKAVISGVMNYPKGLDFQIIEYDLTEVNRVSAFFELARLAKARYVSESS